MEIYFYKIYEDWQYEELDEQLLYHTTNFTLEQWRDMLEEATNHSFNTEGYVSTQVMRDYLISKYNFAVVNIHLHGKVDELNSVKGTPVVQSSIYKDVVNIKPNEIVDTRRRMEQDG